MSHTKGPWTWDSDSDADGGSELISGTERVAHGGWGERVYVDNAADAHLIAAAPDLLEALEAWLRETPWEPSDAQIAQARAAIKRARGET